MRDVLQLFYPECTEFSWIKDGGNDTQITISAIANVESFQIGVQEVPRLFTGLWQLSSPAWGSSTVEKQELALAKLVESGLTAADMADHYVRDDRNRADIQH